MRPVFLEQIYYETTNIFLSLALIACEFSVSVVIGQYSTPSTAMCSAAWNAYFWQGPGSSEAIRPMTTCASEKIVTRSGIVCLLDVVSNALVRAGHSAS